MRKFLLLVVVVAFGYVGLAETPPPGDGVSIALDERLDSGASYTGWMPSEAQATPGLGATLPTHSQ